MQRRRGSREGGRARSAAAVARRARRGGGRARRRAIAGGGAVRRPRRGSGAAARCSVRGGSADGVERGVDWGGRRTTTAFPAPWRRVGGLGRRAAAWPSMAPARRCSAGRRQCRLWLQRGGLGRGVRLRRGEGRGTMLPLQALAAAAPSSQLDGVPLDGGHGRLL